MKISPSAPEAKELEQALADPALRARLAHALASELRRESGWRRYRPFLAGLTSGSVLVLAFLLPSLQEQWARFESSSAVDRYAAIGSRLMNQGHFQPAEQAYSRAFELAGGQRVDLLEQQLRAHVQRINDDPQWPGATPDDLTESDFVYLLELEGAPDKSHERAAALSAYGAFLAGKGRAKDAETQLQEALELDPGSVAAHINYGNLLRDQDRTELAEQEYQKAIALDPQEEGAHFDLALLYAETGRTRLAESEFKAYAALAPDDAEGLKQLSDVLRAQGQPTAAKASRKQVPAESSK